jgi:hypothetical protein
MRSVKNLKPKVYTITLYKTNKARETKDQQEKPLKEVIPNEYLEFLPLFSKIISEMLLPYQPNDHKIKLQDGFTLLFKQLFSLSREELQVSKEWKEKNLST